MRLAGHYQARGIPTIRLFTRGEERARFSGAKSINYVEQFIAEYGR